MALAQVDYYDLRYDRRNNSPVLFLKDSGKDKYLPVWIGELEASSIELAVSGRNAQRPLTHDLMSKVISELGGHVQRVVIDRLESRTYYASLILEHDGREVQLDCRPSDAIAVALRKNCSIFVDEHLMYNIKFVELSESDIMDGDGDDDGMKPEVIEADEDTFKDFLRNITPSDFREG